MAKDLGDKRSWGRLQSKPMLAALALAASALSTGIGLSAATPDATSHQEATHRYLGEGVLALKTEQSGRSVVTAIEAVAYIAHTVDPLAQSTHAVAQVCYVPKEQTAQEGVLHGIQCANDACKESLEFSTTIQTSLGQEKANLENMRLQWRAQTPNTDVTTNPPFMANSVQPASRHCAPNASPHSAPPVWSFPKACIYQDAKVDGKEVRFEPCQVRIP